LGTLTLTNGTNDLSLNFIGDYAGSDFKIKTAATTKIGFV